jgi:hypothetical protein
MCPVEPGTRQQLHRAARGVHACGSRRT